MDHHNTDNSFGFAGGLLASVIGYILSIDWTLFFEQLSTEIIKVIVLGALGGAAGLLGKKVVEKLFFKKKR